jgi:lambda family phage portal protein
MANLFDKAIAYVSPIAAVKRAQARKVLAYYEAAKPDRMRKGRRETGSGNDAVQRAGSSLRQQARHLEQNYDIAVGVLNTLVANVVGPNGIGIEPQPRRKDGTIHVELANELLKLYKDWAVKPEVTWQHDWASAQRLAARSWFRDGEVFAQSVEGPVAYLDHGTRVPFSIELLEADFVPMELTSAKPLIQQGIETNAWGRPVGYHVYKANPLESGRALAAGAQTKRIGSERMLHVATRHRIRQLRGVSVFASVLGRFDDLKDYEESERIAAKVAASMAAYIKKGNPDLYDPEQSGAQRQLKFRPGMIFDDLKPGEEVGTIDTSRPNPNLETYRSGQVKAIAAGTGPTFSSIAKTYDGTYSAQRQELVEGFVGYRTLSNEFIGQLVRPVYEKLVALAVLSGQLRLPADLDRDTLDDAIYIPPEMPWIDPKKEAEAWGLLEDRSYISGPEIIRKRGGNPLDVLDQQARWLQEKKDRDIPVDAGKPAAVPPAPTSETDNAMATLLLSQAKATLREPTPASAPVINNHITMPEQPAPVVNVGGSTFNLPEMQPHFEATVEAPAVSVANTVQAGDVHVSVPAQPAPVVTNEITVAPADIRKIEIVAMPERETSTTVTRDKQGNLSSSTQIERDVE